MTRRIRLAVAGLGRGFTVMLPTLLRHARVQLVAAADPRREARERFASDFGGRVYETFEGLCEDPQVEAVYVATPHGLHAAHACLAAARGKHVLVEKPMALTLDECTAMIDAARQASVQLVVGHSHSFDAPIMRAREIIENGEVGRVRMLTALNYTDFLYRPRRPEELDTGAGGGVLFSQGAHQVDVVRLLGGGRVKSVRASCGAWDPDRPTEGAYAAHLVFEDGAYASLAYSGYAHFDSDEFCGWVGEMGQPKDPSSYGAARRRLAKAPDEASLKQSLNYGGANYAPPAATQARQHPHFGVVIASCERADLRPLPGGVMIYGDAGQRLDPLPEPAVPRAEVIDELYDAMVSGRPPLHSGEWARATLEVCLAILQSAREQKEVSLRNQVGLPNP